MPVPSSSWQLCLSSSPFSGVLVRPRRTRTTWHEYYLYVEPQSLFFGRVDRHHFTGWHLFISGTPPEVYHIWFCHYNININLYVRIYIYIYLSCRVLCKVPWFSFFATAIWELIPNSKARFLFGNSLGPTKHKDHFFSNTKHLHSISDFNTYGSMLVKLCTSESYS